MAERIFSIDLGSAYTKVALRKDPSAESQLLEPTTRPEGEDDYFCFPSVVAVDHRSEKPKVVCGTAADLQDGNGVDVYRNWKKLIFTRSIESIGPAQSPLEHLLSSDDLLQLAAKFQVTPGQVGQLKHLVVAAKSLLGVSIPRAVSAEVVRQTNAPIIAIHYLRWLRQEIMKSCNMRTSTGLKYEDIPVRLAVPAFAIGKEGDHDGCKTLANALSKAGWPVHPERPFVSEPYSNAIGILTNGSNVLRGRVINLGQMFSRGPLITVMKGSLLHPRYRAIVIDVGAFTTDFAALDFKPCEEVIPHPDSGFSVQQESVSFGIGNLDEAMLSALPKEKRELVRRARASEWERFRHEVYAQGKGVRRTDGTGRTQIGGAADAELVKTVLNDFTDKLVSNLRTFCASLEKMESAGLQELILTGGGNSIPTICEGFQKAMQEMGHPCVKIHAPNLKRSGRDKVFDRLKSEFARGGSAIGGASIYFEEEFA